MIEIVVDNFAGGGGASQGIEAALGRPIDYAINHDREAIAMHKANHPHTKHLTEDVWKVDPLAVTSGRRVALGWFSPDCTFHSKARGGKPFRDKNIARRLRGLAWVVVKWARLPKDVRPQIIMLENVEEFAHWGPLDDDGKPCPLRKGFTFRRWWKQLENLGYEVQMRELRACDYGAPTIRKRLFIIARCDGLPIVWPKRTHGIEFIPYRTTAEQVDWDLPVPSIFLTKEEAKAWGKYYGVRAPRRPLAEATLRRIARGVFKYVINNPRPFIVGGGGRMGQSPERPIDGSFQTITAKADAALVVPFLTEHANSSSQRNFAAEEPLRTQCAQVKGGHFALVAPTLIQTGYGEREGQSPRCMDLQKPIGTVVGQGNKHALVTAFLSRHFGQSVGQEVSAPAPTTTADGGGKTALIAAHIVKHCTGSIGFAADEPMHTIVAGSHAPETNPPGGSTMGLISSHIIKLKGTCRDGQPIDQPIHTIQANGTHYGEVRAFLMKYYGTDQNPTIDQSLPTITTKDRFALVTVEGESYAIADIGMRMFTPRELFRCQGFNNDYVIDPLVPYEQADGSLIYKPLTKTAQIRMCGNSVPPDVAEALVRANYFVRRAELKIGTPVLVKKELEAVLRLSTRIAKGKADPKENKIFWNDMTDEYLEFWPYEFLDQVWAIRALTPNLIHQVLTKRIERAHEYFKNRFTRHYAAAQAAKFTGKYDGATGTCDSSICNAEFPYPNVWLGVSDEGDRPERLDILRNTPTAVRWVSFEPLIVNPGTVNLDGVRWVVVGGESGPNARPIHPDWVRSLRDQCVAAGVPFFFKQWGEWVGFIGRVIEADGGFVNGEFVHNHELTDGFPKTYQSPTDVRWMKRVGKKTAGRLLDGREWNEYPSEISNLKSGIAEAAA